MEVTVDEIHLVILFPERLVVQDIDSGAGLTIIDELSGTAVAVEETGRLTVIRFAEGAEYHGLYQFDG